VTQERRCPTTILKEVEDRAREAAVQLEEALRKARRQEPSNRSRAIARLVAEALGAAKRIGRILR